MKTFEEYHANDPYNEEIWAEENYTAEQIQYLKHIKNRLERFTNAYNELLAVWNNDAVFGINLDDWLGDGSYPFDESFDELNINNWYHSFADKMKNFK